MSSKASTLVAHQLSLPRPSRQEDQLLVDAADLKRKLHRIIYKSRDKSIKSVGEYPYPKMLFSTKLAIRARVSFTRT